MVAVPLMASSATKTAPKKHSAVQDPCSPEGMNCQKPSLSATDAPLTAPFSKMAFAPTVTKPNERVAPQKAVPLCGTAFKIFKKYLITIFLLFYLLLQLLLKLLQFCLWRQKIPFFPKHQLWTSHGFSIFLLNSLSFALTGL